MRILYIMIPLAIVFVSVALGLFFWALRSGQYDDLDGPAWDVVLDEDSVDNTVDEADG